MILRLDSTPLLARRMRACSSPSERLFALMVLGDDRAVAASYVMGQPAYLSQPPLQKE